MDLRSNLKIKALKAAFPMTLPVLTGYLFLGIAFGLLMNQAGFPILWTFLSSAVVFAGALQFAGVSILASAFNPLAAFTLAILVNIRHLFYGISMLSRFKGLGFKKNFMIYMMADEAFSINAAAQIPKDVDPAWFYFFTSLLCYLYWNIASLLGHLAGAFLPQSIQGLDFVLTALFSILFLNQWEIKAHRPFLMIGLISTFISRLILGPTNFLWGAMVLIITLMWIIPPQAVNHD